jgi:hypothetical protein
MTLAALQGLLVPFTPNGAPAVFIVSGGLAGPRRDIPLGSRGLGRGAVVPSGCDLRIEDFLKVGEVFTAARAEVLVVQPEDVAPVSVSQVSTPVTVNLTDGLLTLAGAAGGELEHLTAMENPFLGARRALLPFYVATFVPRAAERNSLPQRVEVHVTRDGVPMTVRTRGQIVIPRTLPSRPPATPAADLAALVRQLEVVRDLPIRVTAFATRNQSSATLMDVVAMTEALDGSRHLQTARAALFNRSGAIVTEWSSSGPVPAGPFFASLTVPAGTYRLRVAGVDAAGAGGSADYFVAAELTGAGALRLGGLVVGSIETGSFVPLFEVSRERRPMASMEIYGGCRTDVRAVLEVAATDNGPALATTPLVIAATSEPDRCVASAELPIGTLSSGDFSLRAVVNLPGQPAGRVVRTLRKR